MSVFVFVPCSLNRSRLPSGENDIANGAFSFCWRFRPAHSSLEERTMLRLTKEQRQLLAENVSSAANVAAGALVFGQFLSGQPPSLAMLGLGASAACAALVAWALFLVKKRPL